ncbi:MAG: DUF2271 domain-containing protein, partial [Verrucomicrobiota bacterium]
EAGGILLDIGGDIRVSGDGKNGQPWKIGVMSPEGQADNEAPSVSVLLEGGAIATSGHSARSFEVEGKQYSHIIDSNTGWPVSGTHAATVVAPDALTADVLATAFTAMKVVKAIDLAESMEGVECLLSGYDGRQYYSEGWRGMTIANDSGVKAESLWPEGFGLSVDYEVPKLRVSKYRAPYIAIWVSGTDRSLVKTLIMLGENTRWAEENYYWWRRYARKAPSLVDAISQPSRRPGRYNIYWDGFDDFGNAVPQGDYVLNIEASREHGGRTMAKIELPLLKKKYRTRRKAEGELGGLVVEYSDKKK